MQTPIGRPQGINYRGTDWHAIKRQLEQEIRSLDVVNRSPTINFEDTQWNRAMQAAMQMIIDWDELPVAQQHTPDYAVPMGRSYDGLLGGDYDPNARHPDDDPA